MSDALDRVLEALDVGLQVPPEAMGLHSTDYDDRLCARCRYTDRDGGEFCGACRAWLSSESDVDPLGDRETLEEQWDSWARGVPDDGSSVQRTIEIEVSPEVAAFIRGEPSSYSNIEWDMSEWEGTTFGPPPVPRQRRIP